MYFYTSFSINDCKPFLISSFITLICILFGQKTDLLLREGKGSGYKKPKTHPLTCLRQFMCECTNASDTVTLGKLYHETNVSFEINTCI
jgi:hypothetical protein